MTIEVAVVGAITLAMRAVASDLSQHVRDPQTLKGKHLSRPAYCIRLVKGVGVLRKSV